MCLFLDAFKYILYWDTFQKKKKNNQLSVSVCQRGGRALSTSIYPPTFSTVSLLICHLQVSTCTSYFLI